MLSTVGKKENDGVGMMRFERKENKLGELSTSTLRCRSEKIIFIIYCDISELLSSCQALGSRVFIGKVK